MYLSRIPTLILALWVLSPGLTAQIAPVPAPADATGETEQDPGVAAPAMPPESDAHAELVRIAYMPALVKLMDDGYEKLTQTYRDVPHEVWQEIRQGGSTAGLFQDLVAVVRRHLTSEQAEGVVRFLGTSAGKFYEQTARRLNTVAAEEAKAWGQRMESEVARRLAVAGLLKPPPLSAPRPTPPPERSPEADSPALSRPVPSAGDDIYGVFLDGNGVPRLLQDRKDTLFRLFRGAYPHVEEGVWRQLEAEFPVSDCLARIRRRLRQLVAHEELAPVVAFMESDAGRVYLAVNQDLGHETGRVAAHHLQREGARLREEAFRRGILSSPGGGPVEVLAESDLYERLARTVYLPPLLTQVDNAYFKLWSTVRNVPRDVWGEIRAGFDTEGLVADLVPVLHRHLDPRSARGLLRFLNSPAGQFYLRTSQKLDEVAKQETEAWLDSVESGIGRRLALASLLRPPRSLLGSSPPAPESGSEAADPAPLPSPGDDPYLIFLDRNGIPPVVQQRREALLRQFKRAFPHVPTAFWKGVEADFPVSDGLARIRTQFQPILPEEGARSIVFFMDSEAGRAFLQVHRALGRETGEVAAARFKQEADRLKLEAQRRGYASAPSSAPSDPPPPAPIIPKAPDSALPP